MAACFVAGTLSSLVAALITHKIHDDDAGLRCGPCVCIPSQAVGAEAEVTGKRTVQVTTTHGSAVDAAVDKADADASGGEAASGVAAAPSKADAAASTA